MQLKSYLESINAKIPFVGSYHTIHRNNSILITVLLIVMLCIEYMIIK